MGLAEGLAQIGFDRWWITRFTQPLSFSLFAAGAWLSWRTFPQPFDWQRMVISALLSRHDNPAGYPWIAFGIALSGLLLLPLGGHLHRVLRPRSPAGAKAIGRLVTAGATAMVLIAACARLPPTLQWLHNILAMLIYCSLLSGLLATAVLFARHPEASRLPAHSRPWALPLLVCAILGPILAAVASQLDVYLTHGVAPVFHDRALPAYLNIAFWEWILSALIYGGGWLLAWLARPAPTARD